MNQVEFSEGDELRAISTKLSGRPPRRLTLTQYIVRAGFAPNEVSANVIIIILAVILLSIALFILFYTRRQLKSTVNFAQQYGLIQQPNLHTQSE